MKCNKRGFTLIELLVVVLIISILAAVALPQYKVAVIKSRISVYLPLLKTLVAANENYYLSNGVYATNAAALDVSLPPTCKRATGTNTFQCGNDILVDFSHQNRINITYCPNQNATYASCISARDLIIRKTYLHPELSTAIPGSLECTSVTNLGKKVCQTMTF